MGGGGIHTEGREREKKRQGSLAHPILRKRRKSSRPKGFRVKEEEEDAVATWVLSRCKKMGVRREDCRPHIISLMQRGGM